MSLQLVIFSIALFSVFSLVVSEADGAAYIKFDGIDGESQDKDHKNWSDIASVGEIIRKPTPAKEVVLEDITVTKSFDRSSPKIAESLAKGKVYSSVMIHVCSSYTDAGRICNYQYELKNAIISNYHVSASGQSEQLPIEKISIDFEQLRVIYKSIDESGKVKDTEYFWSAKGEEMGLPPPKPKISEGKKEIQEQMQPKLSEKEKPEVAAKQPKTPKLQEKAKERVPSWVKGTAKFWVDDQVTDRDFTEGIGYLVKEKIIDVGSIEKETGETGAIPEVPSWIKQTTQWWVEGQLPEDQFLEAIKWLIKSNIIKGVS